MDMYEKSFLPEQNPESYGTVFDDVFRTMVQKIPQLLIPLINEVFHTDYSENEAFEQYRNEHEESFGKIISDSIIVIRGKTYHIECQSVDDTTMAIRMVEYDFAIALEQSVKKDRMYEMDFPASCVLYLRSSKNTPDELQVKVNLPDGENFIYRAKTIKLSQFTRDEIFEKHLFLLLPYYILKYEKDAELLAEDEGKLRELLSEYEEIRKQLEQNLLEDKRSVLYADMIDLIIRISDHVFAKKENIRKGVEETMGGKVLKLRSEVLREEGEEKGQDKVLEIVSEITKGNTTLESLMERGYARDISIRALRACGLMPES